MGKGQYNRKLERLTGQDMKQAFITSTHYLEKNTDHINALNVFPVPDGDTGINMLLTMRSVKDEIENLENPPVSLVASKASLGSLMGARGNSGVILSQFLSGFATALENVETCDAQTLANALVASANAAYLAVAKPVEGTMLTVMRELSDAASQASLANQADVIEVCKAAVAAAHTSVSNTPILLNVLAEAGVVDAGGVGIAVLLEGFLSSLLGKSMKDLSFQKYSLPNLAPLPPSINKQFLDDAQSNQYGFCTQFMIQEHTVGIDEIRLQISEMGNSSVVIGNQSIIKVHLHCDNPDTVISYCQSLGAISQINISNMDQQHNEFLDFHSQSKQSPNLGIVAVVRGEGFASLFKSLGCHSVIECINTMNPSTKELIEAAKETKSNQIVILPNNPNIHFTAEQAAKIFGPGLYYIPTKTLPEGVAALLSSSPDLPIEQVLKNMNHVIKGVRTLEILKAVRSVKISGISIIKDQIIGLLDGKLISVGKTAITVLTNSLVNINIEVDQIITIYWGRDTNSATAKTAMKQVSNLLPKNEVELVYGGQPFYDYIVSLE
ncbi:DAK2 domain-containing protein [SAR202 cluster bacterium AC-409-J13_OGT_754m]|nr:DAK2 domain-containing protein [SAR202 cluster bacterium AC-409-J13_OGT_754m]